jgi:hypothetical protein
MAEIADSSSSAEKVDIGTPVEEFNWNDDSENPYNWPKWKKNFQLAATAIIAFTG